MSETTELRDQLTTAQLKIGQQALEIERLRDEVADFRLRLLNIHEAVTRLVHL